MKKSLFILLTIIFIKTVPIFGQTSGILCTGFYKDSDKKTIVSMLKLSNKADIYCLEIFPNKGETFVFNNIESFQIFLAQENLEQMRNMVKKYLEWEETAQKNKVDTIFNKDLPTSPLIPIAIRWWTYDKYNKKEEHLFYNGNNSFNIDFVFHNTRADSAFLYISSNNCVSEYNTSITFGIPRIYMDVVLANIFLKNTSKENIEKEIKKLKQSDSLFQ